MNHFVLVAYFEAFGLLTDWVATGEVVILTRGSVTGTRRRHDFPMKKIEMVAKYRQFHRNS